MYKCYFHPKATSNQLCRGCKLPVCAGCDAKEGFCTECVAKRAVVDELKQLRAASLIGRRSASTTGRLRMPARRAASGNLVMPGLHPMMAGGGGSRSLSGALSRPEPSRYQPVPQSYRGVATPTGELKRPSVKPQFRPEAIAPATFPAWLAPFLGGLGIAIVLLVALGFLALSHSSKSPFKYKPLYHSLTPHEWNSVHQILATRRIDVSELNQPASQAHVSFVNTTHHLSGMRTFQAQVAGAAHLSSLVLLADGRPITSTTFVRSLSDLSFDTTRLTNGPHQLQLIAYAWGHPAARTPSVEVTIAN